MKAKDIGQVFGLAFDDGKDSPTGTPGLYAGATSAFGVQIVGATPDEDGKPVRLKAGAAGANSWTGSSAACRAAARQHLENRRRNRRGDALRGYDSGRRRQ